MPDTWTMKNTPTHDGRPDYDVRRDRKLIGRIYHRAGGMERDWHWAWFLNQFHSLNENLQGQAPTLEKAKSEMRAAWDDLVMRRGIAIVERALK